MTTFEQSDSERAYVDAATKLWNTPLMRRVQKDTGFGYSGLLGCVKLAAEGLLVPKVERDKWRSLCEAVDAHYSGSLDHQPAYVKAIREALDG